MAGNSRWIHDKVGEEHPEASNLLAYVRRQQLEDRLRICRHIEECPRCRQKYYEYEGFSTSFEELLGEMQAHQDYADVPVELVLMRVQKEAARQERRLPARIRRRLEPLGRMGGERPKTVPAFSGKLKPIVGLPMALVLALLIAMLIVSIVVALHNNAVLLRFPTGQSLVHSGSPGSTSVQAHNATPPSDTGSTVPGASQTQEAGTGSKASIRDCSTGDDIAKSRLVICGSYFTPGEKVEVYFEMAESRGPKLRRMVTVDALGNFSAAFTINNCNVPVVIFARDETDTKLHSNILKDISFGSCPVPTPAVGTSGMKG